MRAGALALLLLIFGCSVEPAVPQAKTECSRACDWYREHGCEEGGESRGGGSCEQVCENAVRNGFDLATPCVWQAQSCKQARACH
jgi:hypothetical protein